MPSIPSWRPLRIIAAAFIVSGATVVRADDFDTIRVNYRTMLTGGNLYSPTDPDMTSKLSSTAANNYWTTMLKNSDRTSLWSDLPGKVSTEYMQDSYSRLAEMARAYATVGMGTLTGNAALRGDIISGLDWLYANWYNERITGYASDSSKNGRTANYANENWYNWLIGVPLFLNDATVLMYDDLSSTQVANYMKAIGYFLPTIVPTDSSSTGANLMWKCKITAMRGVLQKNGTVVNDGIAKLSNPVSSLFTPVTASDGFYADGSFIQHTNFAYTGGYGIALIQDVTDFINLYQRPPFAVTDPGKDIVYFWMRHAYEPLDYKGGMVDSVRGREVARPSTTSHGAGRDVISAFVMAAQFAPPAEAAYYKSVVKYLINTDTTVSNHYNNLSLYQTVLAKAIVADASIPSRGELLGHYNYGSMDRAVQLSPGWGASLSLTSSRTFNYEIVNEENLAGWHQGEGMLQLLTSDLNEYSLAYWPTVDSQRLPGTTVEAGSTPASRTKMTSNKSGGVTDVTGRYGLSGLDLTLPGSTLRGKKAWFYSDNKVVCLGAGLTAGGTRTIETIVENRKLNTTGSNAFSVNATAATTPALQTKPAAPVALNGVRFAHLAGAVADGSGDVGFYFPAPASLKAVRETRTGTWADINHSDNAVGTTYTTVNTNRFMTLWLDHGVGPTNATYAYALLPTIDPVRLQTYASAPDFTILENSDTAQAIKDDNTGAIAVMFWNAATKTVGSDRDAITANNVAAVYARSVGTELQVSVADPTQANTGTIAIELARAATSVIEKSSTITVTQMSPTIKMTINVARQAGASQTIRFATSDEAVGPVASRLINLSILTSIATSADSFTMGTVIGGGGTSGSKALLVRAAGPSLGALGVGGTIADPNLEFFNGTTKVGENDNWGGTATLGAAFSAVGAFAYSSPTSKDSAIFNAAAPAGNSSIRVTGVGGATGTVIAELYDSTPTDAFTAKTPRLVNVSVLKQIGTGFTVGFVVGGSAARRTVLIRAVGPGLANVGVTSGFVADPKLDLFAGADKIDGNDNWGGTALLTNAFAQIGAFALPATSKDAALLASLAPGSYSVQVSPGAGAAGLVIVEVYEVP